MANNPNSSHDGNADSFNDNADSETPSSYYTDVTDESLWTPDMDMLSRGFRDIHLRHEYRRSIARPTYGANVNGEGCSSWQARPFVVPPNVNGEGSSSRQARLYVVPPNVNGEGSSSRHVMARAGAIVDMMDKPYRRQQFLAVIEGQSYEVLHHIVYLVTRDETRLLRLAKDDIGVISLKRLIETVKCMPKLGERITSAFGAWGTFELMKDPIGSELVKHFYANLDYEDNMMPLVAASIYFVKLAKDPIGYKTLQFCLDQSSFQHRRLLLNEATNNCCFLANDKHGNFVIQHVLAKYGKDALINMAGITTVTADICYKLGEHLVEFSTDSYASHVIEKCLESDCGSYLLRLLANKERNTLRRLVQDPWGNYVLQTALKIDKGSLCHKLLVHKLSDLPEQLLADVHAKKVMTMVLALMRRYY